MISFFFSLTKKKKAFSCECPEEYTGLLCDNNSDYCSPNPCQNDGICSSEGETFLCNCTGTGFNGTKCQTNINDCSPNPCQNNGTCLDEINCNLFFFFSYFFLFKNPKLNKIIAYTCTCKVGFNGTNCDNNIDDCFIGACKNGGQCIDGINTFSCNCTGTGFDGTKCQTNINDCESNPCENGGTCIDGVHCIFFSFLFYFFNYYFLSFLFWKYEKIIAYTCQCVSGYNGPTCDDDTDDCLPNPCLNNGFCIDGINSYTCDCTGTGFDGTKCQTNINDCASNLCLNGGTCIDGINGNSSFSSFFFLPLFNIWLKWFIPKTNKKS